MDLMIAPPKKISDPVYKRPQNGANGTTVREAFFPQKQPLKQASLNATNIAGKKQCKCTENFEGFPSYSALFGSVT